MLLLLVGCVWFVNPMWPEWNYSVSISAEAQQYPLTRFREGQTSRYRKEVQETQKCLKSGNVNWKQVTWLTHVRKESQNNPTQNNEKYPGGATSCRLFQTVSRRTGNDHSTSSRVRSLRYGLSPNRDIRRKNKLQQDRETVQWEQPAFGNWALWHFSPESERLFLHFPYLQILLGF